MDNESVFRAVMERGFGAGDLSVADKYAGDSIEEHEYLSQHGSTGADVLRGQITEAREAMPGMTVTVEDLVVDGDKVWARSLPRTVHPATGEDVEITVFDLCRFESGKIVEHWGVPDRFALLHQIGALPPPPDGGASSPGS